MNSDSGKWIIIAGLCVVVIGIIIYFFHDKLHWMGHLPGDIRIEKENFRFYFPVTTMILVSLFLSLVIYIAKRLFL
jgi:magnesium-transporting ATPase (P-type)